MTSAETSALPLRALLAERAPAPDAIASLLDALEPAQRLAWVRSLSGGELKRLFESVRGFARMTLEQLVPESVAPFTPVRHFGSNSLPVFRTFEKRFYRTGEPGRICGANFQSTSWLTGPGYFTVAPAADGGEVVFDYTVTPDRAPAGWPALRGNDRGVSRAVYGGMIDEVRRVSKHVSIGTARKRGGPAAAYFVLCRE